MPPKEPASAIVSPTTRASELASRQDILGSQIDSLSERVHEHVTTLSSETKHLSAHVDSKFDHLERRLVAFQEEFNDFLAAFRSKSPANSNSPTLDSETADDATPRSRNPRLLCRISSLPSIPTSPTSPIGSSPPSASARLHHSLALNVHGPTPVITSSASISGLLLSQIRRSSPMPPVLLLV